MINKVFTSANMLPSAIKGYKSRSSQIDAAQYISDAFASYQNIAIEAPTGIGKTMAYLVPVFLSGKRTIISTKTKHLMHQILYKDIPVISSILGERNVVMLKGRKNYFCPYRYERYIKTNQLQYEKVVDWVDHSDQEPLDLPIGVFDNDILDKMSADRYQCLRSKCVFYDSCPFYKVKKAANEADLVVTNHHLLLADISMKNLDKDLAILNFAEHIVFDEAHSIVDIYPMYAGAELSIRRLITLLNDNKDIISFSTIHKAETLGNRIADKIMETRGMYELVAAELEELMNVCSQELENCSDESVAIEFKNLSAVFNLISKGEDGVKFVEKSYRDITVKFIPLEAGASFSDGLSKSAISSVFISATMTSSGSFDYFLKETGMLDKNVKTVVLPTVFDFSKQGLLFVPDIESSSDIKYIVDFVSEVTGSVLLICNSIKRMSLLSEAFKMNIKNKVIFDQSEAGWRELTNRSDYGDMVLVGCAMLRDGLDLVGGNFRCVIIDKLPFEYHQDIYLSQKASKYDNEDGGAFMNFNLPRALLYFKQAVGRLIRQESDVGVWVVLDERVRTKSYGKYFRDVLSNVNITNSADEALLFLKNSV